MYIQAICYTEILSKQQTIMILFNKTFNCLQKLITVRKSVFIRLVVLLRTLRCISIIEKESGSVTYSVFKTNDNIY